MEMKFDLTVANWLAFVADPSVSFSRLGYGQHEKKMLKLFLTKLIEGSFSSLHESKQVLDSMKILLERLNSNTNDVHVFEDCYEKIRQYLGKKQWIAVIIPSGNDQSVDNTLCDSELLGYLVKTRSNNRGLVLHLEQAPPALWSLLDVHGVMETALNKATTWPGVLIWSPGGNSIFLPVNSVDSLEIDVEARLQWIFSKLFSDFIFDLGRLKLEYSSEFPEAFENEDKTVHIIHLSDLNIGNDESCFRMSGIQSLIRSLVDELGQASKILPVITGNFMDNPSEKHINKVANFWEFLTGMGIEEPLLVFGNNDVRHDGNINDTYRNVVTFLNNRVTWHQEEKIAMISVNTVMHGNHEQGYVGKEQLAAIEYEIKRKQDSRQFKFVLLMHHLPVSHENIDPAVQSFYDKTASQPFATAKVIKDIDLLNEFIKKYSVSVLLHGHQHIPLITQTINNETVVGCGRTVGSKSQFDGNVYFSINIISINCFSHIISSRLLAIRQPEVGFVEPKRHEVIFRSFI